MSINDEKERIRSTMKVPDNTTFSGELPPKAMRYVVLGEVLSAKGFDTMYPLCVHFMVNLPKGWENDSSISDLIGITQVSNTTGDDVAHFAHNFFLQLTFFLDSLMKDDEAWRSPVLYLMVVGMASSTRVRWEGYASLPLPVSPGFHELDVSTWKADKACIVDKMKDLFLDVTPSLQDVRDVHIPTDDDALRVSRLGLRTVPSGSVRLRLHVIHQKCQASPQLSFSRLSKFSSSSTIMLLKSVESVISAFHRARERAVNARNVSEKVRRNSSIESRHE